MSTLADFGYFVNIKSKFGRKIGPDLRRARRAPSGCRILNFEGENVDGLTFQYPFCNASI